ncbi:MAG: hypothetical protein ACKVK9_09440 [Nitrospinaceae bacterium]
MKQLKKIALFFFVTAIASTMSFGCKTGPETKSTLDKNHKSEDKKIDGSDYY